MSEAVTTEMLPPAINVRDGYRYLGSIPIAIPVSKLDLSVLVEDESTILDSSRYLMAFIDEGIEDVATLGKLLGMGDALLQVVIRQTYQCGFIFPNPDDTVSLTRAGRAALADTKRLEVSSETVELGVDRMTEKTFAWKNIDWSLKRKQKDLNEMKSEGEEIHEIPHPSRPPALEQLLSSGSRTPQVVAEILGSSGRNRRLIDAVAIEGKVARFYRTDALALRVVPIDGGAREWDFLIGGRLSEEHARAFIKIQARRKRTLLPEPPEHPLDVFEHILGGEELARLDSVARSRSHERLVLAERAHDLTTRSSMAPEGTDVSQIEAALEDVTSQLTATSEMADAALPEILEVHDHRPFLLRQLDLAQYRVLIVAPWVKEPAFDEEVETAIRRTLSRGVYVAIRYGYGHEGVSSSVAKRLEGLSSAFGNFDHADLGNSHVKLFAVDDRFVTSGSFNWLSFRGSPTRTFRDETTFVVTNRSTIDTKFAQYLSAEAYAVCMPPQPPIDSEAIAVVFVEGWTDLRFIQIAAERTGQTDLIEGIDIRFEKGGAEGAAGAAIAFSRNQPDVPMLALFDADEIGQAAAKHVRKYAAEGKRQVLSYGSVFKAHKSGVEAEHLFPPALVQRFVDENGGAAVYDAARKNRKTGEMLYDIDKDSKELFVEWIDANAEPDDLELWTVLLEMIREQLGLDLA